MNHSKNQLTSKDKYRKILASWEVPFSKTSEESWNEVSSRLANLPATTKIYRIQKLVWGSAAAAAVIAGFIFFLYHTKNETVGITALNGEIKETILPDGSKSVLNASTTIVYDTDWSEERSVSLEGEAFFEVKKGSTFTVKTKFGSVEVLGTSFNVFARPEKFEVQCITGKVRVKSGTRELVIEPGESAKLLTGNLFESTFDTDKANWQTGSLVYDNEPLVNVFKELERRFNIVVQTVNISDRKFTGNINGRDLHEALEVLCLAMEMNYEVHQDKTVIISNKR